MIKINTKDIGSSAEKEGKELHHVLGTTAKGTTSGLQNAKKVLYRGHELSTLRH